MKQIIRHATNAREFNNELRQAFTLIELLVSLAIISILAALLLPAVQQVRESSRKTQCQNNIRQIILACDNFHNAHSHYPQGQFLGTYGSGPDSTAWSFLARILPFIEQNNIYEEGNIPVATLRDSGVADATITLFLCPTDSKRGSGPRWDAGNMVEYGFPVGQTNYKGVSGANWGADESLGLGPGEIGSNWDNEGTNGSYDGLSNGDGMFYRTDYKIKRRHSHVRDGLSNTFMIGESLPQSDTYTSWPYSNNAYSTCAIPPNTDDGGNPDDWANNQSFRSDHRGGLNFGYGDGSVRFISENIDLEAYRSAATIDGGEVVTP